MRISTMQIKEIDLLSERNPDWWVSKCAEIADGADLSDVAAEHGWYVSALRRYLKDTPPLERAYQDALAKRHEKRVEEAASSVARIARHRVDLDLVEPQHVLKAAEMILGAQSRGGFTASIPGGGSGGKIKIEVEFVDGNG